MPPSLPAKPGALYWVTVEELNLSYYVGETRSITMYTQYNDLIPDNCYAYPIMVT